MKHLMPCAHNSDAPCTGGGLCEFCSMPQHYGIFYTWDSKGKLVGTQRWLLARDKRNILAWVGQEIERLVSYRETIESIPTKETYDQQNTTRLQPDDPPDEILQAFP